VRDILLIAFVGICTATALFRPFIGLLAFTFLGFFAPQSIVWGIAKTLPLSLIVAVGTIAGFLMGPEHKKMRMQRETVIILALWTVFCFTTIFAINPPEAYDRLIYVSKILIMMLLATYLVNSAERLRLLLVVVAISIGFYGLKGGVFSILSGGNYTVFGPEKNYLFANNAIGLSMSMNLPLLYYLHESEKTYWLRWLFKGMLVFSVPAVICTFSRGAWLGMAVAIGVLVLRSRRKLLMMVLAPLLLVVVFTLSAIIIPERVDQRFDELVNYQQEASAESRFWNWELGRRVGFANPLHGGGFDYYSREIYERYYPEFLSRWPGKVWSCHSIWFTIFGEHGFPGIILWIGLIISCFISIRKIRSSELNLETPMLPPGYATALEASLSSFIVAGTFLDAAYFDIYFYIVVFIIIYKQLLHTTLSPVESEITNRVAAAQYD
jgi:probable O-glycosylation ligase (exosortase A-associated)